MQRLAFGITNVGNTSALVASSAAKQPLPLAQWSVPQDAFVGQASSAALRFEGMVEKQRRVITNPMGGLGDRYVFNPLTGLQLGDSLSPLLLQFLSLQLNDKRVKGDKSHLLLLADDFAPGSYSHSEAAIADGLKLVPRPVDVLINEVAGTLAVRVLQSATGLRLGQTNARFELGPLQNVDVGPTPDANNRARFNNEHNMALITLIAERAGVKDDGTLSAYQKVLKDFTSGKHLTSLGALGYGEKGLLDAILVSASVKGKPQELVLRREDLDRYNQRHGLIESRQKDKFYSNPENINKVVSWAVKQGGLPTLSEFSPDSLSSEPLDLFASVLQKYGDEKKQLQEEFAQLQKDIQQHFTSSPLLRDVLGDYAEQAPELEDSADSQTPLSAQANTSSADPNQAALDPSVGSEADVAGISQENPLAGMLLPEEGVSDMDRLQMQGMQMKLQEIQRREQELLERHRQYTIVHHPNTWQFKGLMPALKIDHELTGLPKTGMFPMLGMPMMNSMMPHLGDKPLHMSLEEVVSLKGPREPFSIELINIPDDKGTFLNRDTVVLPGAFTLNTGNQMAAALANLGQKKELLKGVIEQKQFNLSHVPNTLLLVNSPGGAVDGLMDMKNAIQNHPVPIDILVTGVAASCGGILTQLATGNRFMTPSSSLLLHTVRSGGSSGNAAERNATLTGKNIIQSQLTSIIAKRAGVSEKQALDTQAHDFWTNWAESLVYGKHGLIDAVLTDSSTVLLREDVLDYLSELKGSPAAANKYIKQHFTDRSMGRCSNDPENYPDFEADPLSHPAKLLRLLKERGAEHALSDIPQFKESVGLPRQPMHLYYTANPSAFDLADLAASAKEYAHYLKSPEALEKRLKAGTNPFAI
ncbi:MAG: ATP-dependent Clp protease proteolytic subunit [Candidatus Melainabacteria bacterium]|nr:ATP-dependent Clp protease proteolytic subunit [Candidatus Melainabacteria bacterium]